MNVKSSIAVVLIVAGCGDDASSTTGAGGGTGGATTSTSSGPTSTSSGAEGGSTSSTSSSSSDSTTTVSSSSQGGAGGGTGGAGMGGGTTGIEEALAACEQWRAGYSEVSLLLGCNDPDVDDPTYCDEFAANDCLLESGALWACEAPSFIESNCACVDPKNGPFLDCVNDCAVELQNLINCFGS